MNSGGLFMRSCIKKFLFFIVALGYSFALNGNPRLSQWVEQKAAWTCNLLLWGISKIASEKTPIETQTLSNFLEVPQELERIIHTLKECQHDEYFSLPENVLITGDSKSGKTHLLKGIQHILGNSSTVFCPIETALSEGFFSSTLTKFFDNAADKANKSPIKKCVLLLDNIDALHHFSWHEFNSLKNNAHYRDVIIIATTTTDTVQAIFTTDKISSRFEKQIKLEPLGRTTRHQLLTKQFHADQNLLDTVLSRTKDFYFSDLKKLIDLVSTQQEKYPSIQLHTLFNQTLTKILSKKSLTQDDSDLIGENIKGLQDYIGQIPEKIETFIRLSKKSKPLRYTVETPNKFLLEGKPGTGKTYLIRCIAKELGYGLIIATASDFAQRYVGDNIAKIEDLFTRAKKIAKESAAQKCIIFIDEFDTIGTRTHQNDGASRQANETITKLLTKLNGFEEDKEEALIFMAATNYLNAIDPALIRSGRLDTVSIALPDQETRKKLLEYHINKKLKAAPFPFDSTWLTETAEKTHEKSPADITQIVESAFQKAVIEDTEIHQEHFNAALKLLDKNDTQVLSYYL
jgi:ATP-dependent 26S proteasome regulatory subunit